MTAIREPSAAVEAGPTPAASAMAFDDEEEKKNKQKKEEPRGRADDAREGVLEENRALAFSEGDEEEERRGEPSCAAAFLFDREREKRNERVLQKLALFSRLHRTVKTLPLFSSPP